MLVMTEGVHQAGAETVRTGTLQALYPYEKRGYAHRSVITLTRIKRNS
jgi:hypothetical protein